MCFMGFLKGNYGVPLQAFVFQYKAGLDFFSSYRPLEPREGEPRLPNKLSQGPIAPIRP